MFFADMIVDYGMPLSRILAHLEDLVGPHEYARHDIRLDREEYAERRARIYGQLEREPLREVAGKPVVRSRSDDGFKYYLKDGSWVLVRFSGTEPLIRVYSEAPSRPQVEELLHALEERLGVQQAVPAHG